MAPFDDAKILFVVHIADLAWPLVLSNIDWFQKNAPDKKLLLDEVKFQLANGLVKISSNAAWDTEWLAIRYILWRPTR